MNYWSLICLCILSGCSHTFAQRENVWVLGPHAVDVSNPTPAVLSASAPSFAESSASACDDSGQLLFYTDGSNIWDSDHNLMPNGSDLTTISGDATSSSTQGTCIVPVPGAEGQYFVFSSVSLEFGLEAGKLFYSKVDLSLNGGKGDVVPGQKAIFLGEGFTEKLIAVTGTRCNIWVISRSRMSSTFKSYEVTAEGVDHNPVESVTGIINFSFYSLGTLTASRDGKKILSAAAHIAGGGLEIYDFDQETGVLLNPVVIDSTEPFYSACFSPDQSKVYAINYWYTGDLYQYSINVPNPVSTKALLRDTREFGFEKIKLAENGKIYLKGGPNTLDVINLPNLPAPACDLTLQAVVFDSAISGALPNSIPVFEEKSDTFSSATLEVPCWGENFTIQGFHQGWRYQSNGLHEGPVIDVDTPGTYWLSYYTPPCRHHVDTFYVSFPNGVLPTITTMAECRSDSNGSAYAHTYAGDPVEYTYTWIRAADTLAVGDTLTGVSSGAYSLHVQTSTGCDTLLFFDIPEEDFRVSFEVSDTLICLDDVIELTNTSDTHFVRYHWAFDNEDTSVVQTPLPYVYPESGAYRLMLTGEGAICKDTAYQTVLVDQPILPDFKIEPKAVCVGQSVSFFPATYATTVQLTWDIEGQLHIDPQVQPRYQHSFASSGSFPVTLNIQSRACPDTSYTDSIRVYPYPEVDLGADSSICLHGQPVYLKNLREAPLSPYHQVWSTGDTTEDLKVIHPGVYTLSVTAEPMGCTTTESIEISKDCYIDIPNAFTPDGDGNNDYFFPRQLLSESLTQFRMQVFNRWGQLLYETNRVDGRGWDGQFNGRAQPSGVYLYRIEAGFNHGRQENYEGNLTLLR